MEDHTEVAKKNVHHGHNIRRIRKAKGVKQSWLAEVLEVSQQTISALESQKVISKERLLQVANILEIAVEVLVNMEEDPALGMAIENHDFQKNNEDVTIQTAVMNVDDLNLADEGILAKLEEKNSELYERLIQANVRIAQLEEELKQQRI